MLKIKPIYWDKFFSDGDECYEGKIEGNKESVGRIECVDRQPPNEEQNWLVDIYSCGSVWTNSFGDAIRKGQEIFEKFIKSCILNGE